MKCHTVILPCRIRPMLFDGPPAVMMTGSDDGSLPPVFFVNSRNLHKQYVSESFKQQPKANLSYPRPIVVHDYIVSR